VIYRDKVPEWGGAPSEGIANQRGSVVADGRTENACAEQPQGESGMATRGAGSGIGKPGTEYTASDPEPAPATRNCAYPWRSSAR